MLLGERDGIVALEEDRPAQADGPGRGGGRRRPAAGGGDRSEERATGDAGFGNLRHGALCSCRHGSRLGVLAIVVGLSAGAIAAQDASVPAPRFTEVYQAGDGRLSHVPDPVAHRRRNGTLLAFAEARRAGAGDAGDIDLVVKRSRDGGRDVVGRCRSSATTGRTPSATRARCSIATTGTIWLLTTQNRGTDRERDIVAGTSQGTRTVWAMKSTDDGETWSAPVEITASVKRPDWTWYATGPGVGIQTRGGRLVVPGQPRRERGTGVHRSHIVYSDDGGAHWRSARAPTPGTNESQIVELSDGRLMLNMRNHPPKPENLRMVAISARRRAHAVRRPLPDRGARRAAGAGQPHRAAGGRAAGRARLVFANPASARRERLTVRVSDDDGATWPIARVVHEGPAAYSSLVALPDGSIGLLFERGDRSPYERITFARLTLGVARRGPAADGAADDPMTPAAPGPPSAATPGSSSRCWCRSRSSTTSIARCSRR